MSVTGVLGIALGLALLAYLPFLAVPLISDDYIQILLGRQFAPVRGWGDLAADALYRCRATSIFLTYAVDQWLGADATVHRLLNVVLHCASVALLALLGRWRRVGWPVATAAALFFAVHEGHQEAVVWSAAMPELLVFLFVMGSFLCWREGYRPASLALFGLALLSKESGVALVPVLAWYWWVEEKRERSGVPWLVGMAGLAALYTAAIFAAGDRHLHLNDAGTFSLSAPVHTTMFISLARLLWIWGVLALVVLYWLREYRDVIWMSLGWMMITLAPYAFVSYMDRVPSRHTYLASAGLALLCGAAFTALRERWEVRWRWAPLALAAVVVVHNVGYLWGKKLNQYYERSWSTEHFIEAAEGHDRPIVVGCAPYTIDVYRAAAVVRLGAEPDRVQAESTAEDSVRFCDPFHP